jgi:hypothetical protein
MLLHLLIERHKIKETVNAKLDITFYASIRRTTLKLFFFTLSVKAIRNP